MERCSVVLGMLPLHGSGGYWLLSLISVGGLGCSLFVQRKADLLSISKLRGKVLRAGEYA
jgi:hypothetical protein